MHYELEENDKVIIQTQAGDIYNAVVLDMTDSHIFVNMAGFGKLNLTWNDILTIKKIVLPVNRGLSYSPTYRVLVWMFLYAGWHCRFLCNTPERRNLIQ